MPWQVLDYQVFTKSVSFEQTSAFLATALVQFPKAVPGGQIFRLERYSCQVTPPSSPPTGFIFPPVSVAVYDVWPILATTVPCDETPDGVYDIGDNSAPITLLEGNLASFLFSAATLGMYESTATIRCQYQILGGGPSSQPTPVAGAGGAPVIPQAI